MINKEINQINSWNEPKIVKGLLRCRSFRERYEFMVPNCYTQHDNEADIFAVRKSGFADEIEIKVSRSDFLLDKNKVVQYRVWERGEFQSSFERENKLSPVQKFKMQALVDGNMAANYFWYAVPRGMLSINEIPEFAGLIEISDSGRGIEVKKPKLLHRKKPTESYKYHLSKKISYRYWNLYFEKWRASI